MSWKQVSAVLKTKHDFEDKICVIMSFDDTPPLPPSYILYPSTPHPHPPFPTLPPLPSHSSNPLCPVQFCESIASVECNDSLPFYLHLGNR